jgi:photosystem II stability/assembly factor-like uncharacterized protein
LIKINLVWVIALAITKYFLITISYGQTQPLTEVKYTQESCYSRSVKVFKNHIITGNSNGKIYAINLTNNKVKCLTQERTFGEIRDIEISGHQILGLQSADSGAIVKVHLKKEPIVYKGDSLGWKSRFLDGMAIQKNIGFIMGDPVESVFSLYFSMDRGLNWTVSRTAVKSYEGEAGFAASGTNVQLLGDSLIYFVSGGHYSRFFKSNDLGQTWEISELPYSSNNTSGAYSLCMYNDLIGAVVGGDYTNPNDTILNSFYTLDGGNTWQKSEVQPSGYRSCVIQSNQVLFCCGTNGIDYSLDFGKNWTPFASGNYFAMTTHKDKLYATTTNGTFHIFEIPKE